MAKKNEPKIILAGTDYGNPKPDAQPSLPCRLYNWGLPNPLPKVFLPDKRDQSEFILLPNFLT